MTAVCMFRHAIKERFENEIIRSHPVAINGFRMRVMVSGSGYLRPIVDGGVTERHKSVSDCEHDWWPAMTD